MTDGEPPEDSVYHLELRQFPHNVCRFNIAAEELREKLLVPWAQERWVEFGERKWSPHQATLTVLRGPRIPFAQLTMGRGWRAAQRDGRDVTQELLAAVRGELESSAAAPVASSAPPVASAGAAAAARETPLAHAAPSEEPGAPCRDIPQPPTGERRVEDLAADSLGLELLGRLGSEPAPLRRVWELAAERNPDAAASATLALAEGAVQSLLRARLVVLVRVAPGSGEGVPVGGEEAAVAVRAAASWAGAGEAGAGEPGTVALRRV